MCYGHESRMIWRSETEWIGTEGVSMAEAKESSLAPLPWRRSDSNFLTSRFPLLIEVSVTGVNKRKEMC